MVIQRGQLWWATLPAPLGSEPGYRRPVLVISSDRFNSSSIDTVIVASLTTNLSRADAPGNVFVPKRRTKLRRDSVVNVTQLATIDKDLLAERIGNLPGDLIVQVVEGLHLVLALP